MSKTFGDVHKGDKLYRVKFDGSRVIPTKDGDFMEVLLVKNSSSYPGYHDTMMSIVTEDNSGIYPTSKATYHVYRTSIDTSPYKKLNAYIYGTTKRECLNAAIETISKTCEEQAKFLEDFNTRMKCIIDDGGNAKDMFIEALKDADLPDNMEEFAEMALC